MPKPPKPPKPNPLIGQIVDAIKAAVYLILRLVAGFAAGLVLLVVILPSFWVGEVTRRYVLDSPAPGFLFLPAFFGLLFGIYLLPISLLLGTFSRRLSTRIAKLSPVPLTEAEPGK